MFPALFLDRDGVIIENRHDYVRSWHDVSVLPGALQAMACLSAFPHRIVIITNQSAIGRGLVTLRTVQSINRRLTRLIVEAGGRVDGTFLCPHAPEEQCACRKPQPGLLLQAARRLHIDLNRSTMIGDAWSDLQAGQAAQVPNLIMVRTGRGADQLRLPVPPGLGHFQVCDDLQQAILYLGLPQAAIQPIPRAAGSTPPSGAAHLPD